MFLYLGAITLNFLTKKHSEYKRIKQYKTIIYFIINRV